MTRPSTRFGTGHLRLTKPPSSNEDAAPNPQAKAPITPALSSAGKAAVQREPHKSDVNHDAEKEPWVEEHPKQCQRAGRADERAGHGDFVRQQVHDAERR